MVLVGSHVSYVQGTSQAREALQDKEAFTEAMAAAGLGRQSYPMCVSTDSTKQPKPQRSL
jgi:hypothetical protein